MGGEWLIEWVFEWLPLLYQLTTCRFTFMPSLKYLITFLLALIPAAVWMVIFVRKHKINPWTIFFTFVGGILAAQLILLYKGGWDESINLLFFRVDLVDFRSNINALFTDALVGGFVVFLGIAMMEEFSKFIIMKSLNKNHFRSIDDVISLAIVSALGFSFYENMTYFNAQWENLAGLEFTLFVISRITIVTMVHMLCSGVLGYYFGLAHFASPILRLQHKEKKRHPITNFIKSVLYMRSSNLYRDEMMVVGLLLAIFLHAIYNFILSPLVPVGPTLVAVVLALYFFGGYTYLNYLIKKKESRIELGLIMKRLDKE